MGIIEIKLLKSLMIKIKEKLIIKWRPKLTLSEILKAGSSLLAINQHKITPSFQPTLNYRTPFFQVTAKAKALIAILL